MSLMTAAVRVKPRPEVEGEVKHLGEGLIAKKTVRAAPRVPPRAAERRKMKKTRGKDKELGEADADVRVIIGAVRPRAG